ncbi:MAG: hypothetical protein ACAI44_39925 [Candidatus Sericytochromatia bacterium]
MNKRMLLLPILLVSATALLMFSMTLPETTVIADCPNPPCAKPTPTPDGTGKPTSPTPTPSGGIVPVGTTTPTPTPTPTPSGSPLPSFGIAATTPDAVLREARIQAGRVDPFKSVFAPDLPEFTPALEPEQLALPSLPPLPENENPSVIDTGEPRASARPTNPPAVLETPPPRPPLDQGLVLKGIMDGGVDPIAIIEVHGRTELVRVGERLSGGILVTSINFDERRVTLSRGSERASLTIPEPQAPSF